MIKHFAFRLLTNFILILCLLVNPVVLGQAQANNETINTESNVIGEKLFKGTALIVLSYLLIRMATSIAQDIASNRLADAEKATIVLNENISDADLEYLARVIHGEARGEPFIGQIAVGAVVLNRVQSPRFPNTIREVIMAENQFTCVSDGQFYLLPGEQAFAAARQALAGEDPSLGALYFYNPQTARNMSWFNTLQPLIKIGNHLFATDGLN